MDDLLFFEGPKLTLEMARQSAADFERRASAFLQSNTYSIVSRIDNGAKQQVFSYRFANRMPPIIRAVASNVIINVKHALDQAVSDAAVALGRPNAKGIYFPIAPDERQFEDALRNCCRNVRPEIVAFIKAIGPYYGGQTDLYIFLRLSGPAKHQRIVRISVKEDGFILNVDPNMRIPGPAYIGPRNWNEARNELEFLRISIGSTYNADIVPVLEVVLDEGKPPLRGAATTIFEEQIRKAENIIVSLEAETCRWRGREPPAPRTQE